MPIAGWRKDTEIAEAGEKIVLSGANTFTVEGQSGETPSTEVVSANAEGIDREVQGVDGI